MSIPTSLHSSGSPPLEKRRNSQPIAFKSIRAELGVRESYCGNWRLANGERFGTLECVDSCSANRRQRSRKRLLYDWCHWKTYTPAGQELEVKQQGQSITNLQEREGEEDLETIARDKSNRHETPVPELSAMPTNDSTVAATRKQRSSIWLDT